MQENISLLYQSSHPSLLPSVCQTMIFLRRAVAVLILVILKTAVAVPAGSHGGPLETRQVDEKMVFCHYMVRAIRFSKRTTWLITWQVGAAKSLASAADYSADMRAAANAGIDALALNIGPDGWAETQLGYAYDSAAENGMKVFISFDFNRFKTTQALDVANILKSFINHPAQLRIGGKPFVSTFSGDGLDLPAVRNFVRENTGSELFFVPNFKASNIAGADGLFNWMAWPSNGKNKAPDGTANVPVKAGDEQYQAALGSFPYMARKF